MDAAADHLVAKRGAEYAPWLALARVDGLGRAGFKKLADHFNDPTQALSLPEGELTRVPGLEKLAIQGLLAFSEWDEVEKEIERIERAGVGVIAYSDGRYPARLRAIPDPPPFLYVLGDIRKADERAVAVVGSRNASHYGVKITRELCKGLAALGFTVVSGMARGIDGEAHKAAMEAGGITVAVLGSGVDVAYPREHEGLYEKIGESGAVLSELPMGTPPFSFNFPSRNRLISGLSLGVVVVEATEKSGSLITAGLALEQGREVFAVPGEAGASRSRGTHRLIRQGAKLVERVEDIIEEIAPQLLSGSGQAQRIVPAALPADLSPEAGRVFAGLLEGPVQIDELIEESGLPAAQVSGILLDLEIRGLILQLPGKRFRAA